MNIPTYSPDERNEALVDSPEGNTRSAHGLRFAILFALIYAVALLPPVYIALSKQHALVAAIPGVMWYLLLVSAAGILAACALWATESRQGALD